ncbi:unnamed protein product [Polarella glacialis]|uniref:Uncharacterized protein n=1 Tax=Polarella glacialis TaxID=89957 RepID=A0A813GC66_POLGL|nr:unnamed protein product [Polarella glacialis]
MLCRCWRPRNRVTLAVIIVDEADKKGSKRKVSEQAKADDVQESSDEVPAGQETPDEVSARRQERQERQERRDARSTPRQPSSQRRLPHSGRFASIGALQNQPHTVGALQDQRHTTALASQAAAEDTLGRAKEKKQQRKKAEVKQQRQHQQQQQQGKKAADPGQSGTLHPSLAAKPSALEAASERQSTERQERKKAEEQNQSGA